MGLPCRLTDAARDRAQDGPGARDGAQIRPCRDLPGTDPARPRAQHPRPLPGSPGTTLGRRLRKWARSLARAARAGLPGGTRQVHRWLIERRTAPAKTGPHVRRRARECDTPQPATAMRQPCPRCPNSRGCWSSLLRPWAPPMRQRRPRRAGQGGRGRLSWRAASRPCTRLRRCRPARTAAPPPTQVSNWMPGWPMPVRAAPPLSRRSPPGWRGTARQSAPP